MMESVNKDFWRGRWQSGSTPWDHGTVAPPFEEFIERHGGLPASTGHRGLVPGCGSGHEVRFFAGLGLQVTGLDLAEQALLLASRIPHPGDIRWLCGDFLQPEDWSDDPFDWLIEHTCLCAMPPDLWENYVRSAARLLRPGAYFLGIFYVRTREPGGPPYQIEPSRIDALFDRDFLLKDRFEPTRTFPSRMGREEVRLYQRRPWIPSTCLK